MSSPIPLMALLVVAGRVLVHLAANWSLLRRAFAPFEELGRGATRVNLDDSATHSSLTSPPRSRT